MLEEHERLGEDYYDADLARKDFTAYLQKLAEVSRDLNLPSGIVPMTIYWLVKDDEVVLGESRLRHSLTPALKHHGGHLGYVIRPSQRQKGYGTLILALTLEKARDLLGDGYQGTMNYAAFTRPLWQWLLPPQPRPYVHTKYPMLPNLPGRLVVKAMRELSGVTPW
jgi:GNAT superfamily N-acetyltransferase